MPRAADFKVLVVDDQLAMRGLARYSLQQIGITQVTDSPNGKEALQALIKNPVDLVMSDFNMPEMDGLGLLRAIRSNNVLRKTPFILVTGRSDKELVVKAAQAGANNYIVKPFTVQTLKKKLETVIGKLT